MIKEKSKKKSKQKNIFEIFAEYAKTIGVSFLAALIFTLIISAHARSEMIKNLYANPAEQKRINEEIAKQIVQHSDLMKNLTARKYAICLQVGSLYETIGDYENAAFAYRLAIQKVKPGIYAPYLNLVNVLVAQEKFEEALDVLNSVQDINSKSCIKFKTRAYITIGDKYYSLGKFLSAAKNYKKAKYYYNKFSKKDKLIEKSIITRIVNSYIETADIMVRTGLNSDAIRYLLKAEQLDNDNFELKYKLAIVYSDKDPIKAVEYFEPLLSKKPQLIDYGVYSKALMKAANIADLEEKPTLAKYYRYKIHSLDIFTDKKVLYKNDIEVLLNSFIVKKLWFKYKLNAQYQFRNISHSDMNKLTADFVLRQNEEVLETVTKKIATKSSPLLSNGGESAKLEIIFGKKIYTKKELEQYVIDIYLYKDEKYKTLITTMKVPTKSILLPQEDIETLD